MQLKFFRLTEKVPLLARMGINCVLYNTHKKEREYVDIERSLGAKNC